MHMERFCSDGPFRSFFSPLSPVIDAPRETPHIMLRKSQGFSCSFSSYSREIGRIACSASMCVMFCMFFMPSESSKSIMVVTPLCSGSNDGQAVERRERSRVAQEQLDQMVADVAVAAQHLDG